MATRSFAPASVGGRQVVAGEGRCRRQSWPPRSEPRRAMRISRHQRGAAVVPATTAGDAFEHVMPGACISGAGVFQRKVGSRGGRIASGAHGRTTR